MYMEQNLIAVNETFIWEAYFMSRYTWNIWEIQIKTVRYNCTSIRTIKICNTENTNSW